MLDRYTENMKNRLYAAVDLGSVSFHLVIMTEKHNRLVWVECKKEILRLAAGIDPATGRLSSDLERKTIRALHYFAKTLAQHDIRDIRVVGTAVFRQLKDHRRFLRSAEKALGHPIQILTGDEEARYIYRGVCLGLPLDQRFVIDIGGGSTEVIVGHGSKIVKASSSNMGCITLTQKYFNGPQIDHERFQQAEAAAKATLSPLSEPFKSLAWNAELGTSGTIKAISWAMQNLNISDGVITKEGLASLRSTILSCTNQSEMAKKLHLNPRRSSVFCGGFVMLEQAFECFGLSYLKIAQGAIREGMIADMIAKDSAQIDTSAVPTPHH